MRLSLDARTRALLARLPRTNAYAASELLLLAVLAVQGARLLWTVATPVTPLGAWRPATDAAPALGRFDPFFRLAADEGGALVVTAANLKLFGVRADMVSGRGSAIIALPDGRQQSFAVGDEVLPGVRLDAVRSDGVTLLRGGAREQLFLDQSAPAAIAGPGVAAPLPVIAAPPPAAAIPAPPPPPAIQNAVTASPEVRDGRVTGFTLQPNGDGQAFLAAGLQPGDVLLSVDGRRVADGGAASLPALLAGGQGATLEIERGGRPMTIAVPAPR